MSGHSKWSTIKRAKEKTDAQKGKMFTKIGREIAVAVKTGGSDINTNSRLWDAVQKARKCNMPNDAIHRSINKSSDAIDCEEVIYEGYGKNGVAVIVKTLTDNRNRTAGEVRCAFDKYGAGMGTPNSVMFMFNHQGEIFVDRNKCTEDELFIQVTEAGAEDFLADKYGYTILTSVQNFKNVCDAVKMVIKSNDFESEIIYAPTSTIELSEEQYNDLQKLIEKLEESDDVQEVYHNAN